MIKDIFNPKKHYHPARLISYSVGTTMVLILVMTLLWKYLGFDVWMFIGVFVVVMLTVIADALITISLKVELFLLMMDGVEKDRLDDRHDEHQDEINQHKPTEEEVEQLLKDITADVEHLSLDGDDELR